MYVMILCFQREGALTPFFLMYVMILSFQREVALTPFLNVYNDPKFSERSSLTPFS